MSKNGIGVKSGIANLWGKVFHRRANRDMYEKDPSEMTFMERLDYESNGLGKNEYTLAKALYHDKHSEIGRLNGRLIFGAGFTENDVQRSEAGLKLYEFVAMYEYLIYKAPSIMPAILDMEIEIKKLKLRLAEAEGGAS